MFSINWLRSGAPEAIAMVVEIESWKKQLSISIIE